MVPRNPGNTKERVRFMLKLIVSGFNGRMGQVVYHLASEHPAFTPVAGFTRHPGPSGAIPLFAQPEAYKDDADVVVDFSNHDFLSPLLSYCLSRRLPVVLASTGYTEVQQAQIVAAAEKIPVFQSANMSVGINALMALVKQAAAALGKTWDIEIVERHHNKKLDAPSGTALMLADAAKSALPFEAEYVYERQSARRPRAKKEIGISAVRGGTIVGDHDVIFAGHNEVIELTHRAQSREVFASGALEAALFLSGKPAGLYSMQDLLAQ